MMGRSCHLPKATANFCRERLVIPASLPRSLPTSVGKDGSFQPSARACLTSADMSCYRLVGTLKDLSQQFFLINIKG